MPIYIDLDLCDQNEDCPAATYCLYGALYFDHSENKLKYDREKCQNCGTCVNHCGPGALYYAKDDEELNMLVEELKRLKEI
ncbi:hypothetical protein ciss_15190 [Carboxydothermus islandicus]|uniref:4Fe-4S ferredoxin-type domain-containing protein n=1 Tax=Carboxydothermus islandicus TaxID=661089 RepID=A0A1L8D316_9THEO|nr:4Fe-4S binding protein [Carboxydothermus islandicus]GAV25586.1 hypothetical protein ciss_15190 [Carboxydothermus islandicus]